MEYRKFYFRDIDGYHIQFEKIAYFGQLKMYNNIEVGMCLV